MDEEKKNLPNVHYYRNQSVAKKPLIANVARYNPHEVEHQKYLPVAKSVIGRVWSKIRVGIWVDTNGEEHKKADFKLFLYGGEPKYRCTCLFEQADDAMMLKKGEWIRVTGLDEVCETYKSGKIYHNMKVVKIEILPGGYHIIDWRPLWEMYEQIVEENWELIQRVTKLESIVSGKKIPEEELMTASDKRHKRLMKKMQSLKPIVGDIYKATDSNPYKRKNRDEEDQSEADD